MFLRHCFREYGRPDRALIGGGLLALLAGGFWFWIGAVHDGGAASRALAEAGFNTDFWSGYTHGFSFSLMAVGILFVAAGLVRTYRRRRIAAAG